MENFEVLSNAVYDAIEDGEVAIKVSCVAMNKLIEMNKELLAALEAVANCGRGSSGRIILDEFDEQCLTSAIAKAKGTA